jgi:hypothetical protein
VEIEIAAVATGIIPEPSDRQKSAPSEPSSKRTTTDRRT